MAAAGTAVAVTPTDPTSARVAGASGMPDGPPAVDPPAVDPPAAAPPVGDPPAADPSAAAPPADEADEPSAPATRVRGRRLLVLLTALTLVLAVAAVALAIALRGYTAREDARQQALLAARQLALNLTAVDTVDYEGDVAKVRAAATGQFLADFVQRTANGELKKVLVDNKSRSQGTVVDAGIVRADERSATVLVAIDVVVSNTATPQGRESNYRMRINVEKSGGAWRTSLLEFVA